jgi:hypothetical protein
MLFFESKTLTLFFTQNAHVLYMYMFISFMKINQCSIHLCALIKDVICVPTTPSELPRLGKNQRIFETYSSIPWFSRLC